MSDSVAARTRASAQHGIGSRDSPELTAAQIAANLRQEAAEEEKQTEARVREEHHTQEAEGNKKQAVKPDNAWRSLVAPKLTPGGWARYKIQVLTLLRLHALTHFLYKWENENVADDGAPADSTSRAEHRASSFAARPALSSGHITDKL